MENPHEKTPGDAEHAGEMVENSDVKAGRTLASKRHHPVIHWISQAGEIGDQGPLYLIGGVVTVTGAFRKDPRCLGAGLAMLAAVGIADLIKSKVKDSVKRTRPQPAIEKSEYRFETGGSGEKEEQSFPSGHTACTVAAVEAVARFYPRTSPYLRAASMLMASSRVAKGKHWPLDLLAGARIGVASHWLVKWLIPDTLLGKLGVHSAFRPSLHQ